MPSVSRETDSSSRSIRDGRRRPSSRWEGGGEGGLLLAQSSSWISREVFLLPGPFWPTRNPSAARNQLRAGRSRAGYKIPFIQTPDRGYTSHPWGAPEAHSPPIPGGPTWQSLSPHRPTSPGRLFPEVLVVFRRTERGPMDTTRPMLPSQLSSKSPPGGPFPSLDTPACCPRGHFPRGPPTAEGSGQGSPVPSSWSRPDLRRSWRDSRGRRRRKAFSSPAIGGWERLPGEGQGCWGQGRARGQPGPRPRSGGGGGQSQT